MSGVNAFQFMNGRTRTQYGRECGVLLLVALMTLSACGDKEEKKPGQALARVNGEEITILQVNDELERAAIQPEQQAVASQKILETLIDRQLIHEEAVRNKLDRTPAVMQEIERAKMQIIAQKFLQNITSKIPKASRAEIEDYYQKNPDFFAQRKEFFLKQMAIASRDFDKDIVEFINSAKSLDEVAEWLDRRGVRYARGQTTRSTADLPNEAVEKLADLRPGQLFLVNEGENNILNQLVAARGSPVSLNSAESQIEQILQTKKSQEAAQVEIAHLRSLAKIEYMNASAPAATAPASPPDSKAADTATPEQK